MTTTTGRDEPRRQKRGGGPRPEKVARAGGSDGVRKGQLGFLTGTHVVNDLYQGALPALLPFLVSERHYSYSALSGISLAATGLSSVVQPLFGALADRAPRPWLVPAGFLVAAAGVAGTGLFSGYLLTWICAAVAGIGIAAYHPPATNQARAAGGRSQKAMSVFSVGGTLGGSLAPGFVTLVVGAAGLRGTWLLAVPALVMAALWVAKGPWMRARGIQEATVVIPAAGARSGGAGARDDWHAFGRLVVVAACWSVPYVTTVSLVSLFMIRELDSSRGTAAAVLTSFTLAGAVGTLLGGWAADRYGRLAAIRSGYVLAVPAMAALVFAPGVAVGAIGVAVLGFAMFVPFSSQVTLAQDYLPNRPGTASGVTLGLTMSVGGLGSPLFGRLADAHGLRVTFAVVLAFLVVALLAALRLRERTPQAPVAESGPEPVVRSVAEPVPGPGSEAAGEREGSEAVG
ncbi:MFS transporter [Streptomyces sp. NBC_01335]|uniref:MFS transporter n=1 Tax=Streptomyces sp. NBC_01335 TaxID=2903828 RepID=UPI002E126B12|nr:MFS transporter [Streptomyces sp. NBC_01335]